MNAALLAAAFVLVAALFFAIGYSVADCKLEQVLAEIEDSRKQAQSKPGQPVKRYLEYTGKHLRTIARYKDFIIHGEN